MNFVTVRVFYRYPADGTPRSFAKEYTVPDNEPFPEAHAYRQWQKDHSLPHALIAYTGTAIVAQPDSAPIIQLPLGFCETKYPGYFWEANEKKLYSLKSGKLREIKHNKFYHGRYGDMSGYPVSHNGKRRRLKRDELMKLVPTRAVIPKAPVQKPLGARWQ